MLVDLKWPRMSNNLDCKNLLELRLRVWVDPRLCVVFLGHARGSAREGPVRLPLSNWVSTPILYVVVETYFHNDTLTGSTLFVLDARGTA